MGYLLDGTWRNDAPNTDAHGRFVRQASRFHHWVTPDGAPGPAQLSSRDDVDDLEKREEHPQDRGGVDDDGECVVVHASPKERTRRVQYALRSVADALGAFTR